MKRNNDTPSYVRCDTLDERMSKSHEWANGRTTVTLTVGIVSESACRIGLASRQSLCNRLNAKASAPMRSALTSYRLRMTTVDGTVICRSAVPISMRWKINACSDSGRHGLRSSRVSLSELCSFHVNVLLQQLCASSKKVPSRVRAWKELLQGPMKRPFRGE